MCSYRLRLLSLLKFFLYVVVLLSLLKQSKNAYNKREEYLLKTSIDLAESFFSIAFVTYHNIKRWKCEYMYMYVKKNTFSPGSRKKKKPRHVCNRVDARFTSAVLLCLSLETKCLNVLAKHLTYCQNKWLVSVFNKTIKISSMDQSAYACDSLQPEWHSITELLKREH